MGFDYVYDAVLIAIMTLGASYVFQSWFQWYADETMTTWIYEKVKPKWAKTLLKPTIWCSLCMTSIWGLGFILLASEAPYWYWWDYPITLFMAAFFNTLFDAIVLRIEGT